MRWPSKKCDYQGRQKNKNIKPAKENQSLQQNTILLPTPDPWDAYHSPPPQKDSLPPIKKNKAFIW